MFHFDGKQVDCGFPSYFSLISCRHAMAGCSEFDGNRTIPIFPSNSVFVLMEKVAPWVRLIKKNSKQAARFSREFDGNLVAGCFPSNSDIIPKKQAEHFFRWFDGNTGDRSFPSKFCLFSQKQTAPVRGNEADILTGYVEFNRIRYTLAILLNLRAVLHPNKNEREHRRKP